MIAVGDYLDRFRDKRNKQSQAMIRTSDTPPKETFHLSYQHVKTKDPEALELLTLCSFMAPNFGIPWRLLEAAGKETGK